MSSARVSALATGVLAFLLAPPAGARTIPVRAGQALSTAIALAAPGDTVAVGPGAYDETVDLTSGVALLGAGARRTILTRPHGDVVRIRAGGQGTALRHLTIRTASIGIAIEGGAPLVEDCEVEDCQLFGVTVSDSSNAELRRNFLRNNQGDAVVVRSGSSSTIHDCHILGNRAGLRVEGASARVARTELTGNQVGVLVRGAGRVVLGDRPEAGCRIHKNRRANLENETSEAVRARYNYWGDTRCQFLRGFEGRVIYLPFMDLALEDSLGACP